jgi:hypothetical protein
MESHDDASAAESATREFNTLLESGRLPRVAGVACACSRDGRPVCHAVAHALMADMEAAGIPGWSWCTGWVRGVGATRVWHSWCERNGIVVNLTAVGAIEITTLAMFSSSHAPTLHARRDARQLRAWLRSHPSHLVLPPSRGEVFHPFGAP